MFSKLNKLLIHSKRESGKVPDFIVMPPDDIRNLQNELKTQEHYIGFDKEPDKPAYFYVKLVSMSEDLDLNNFVDDIQTGLEIFILEGWYACVLKDKKAN